MEAYYNDLISGFANDAGDQYGVVENRVIDKIRCCR